MRNLLNYGFDDQGIGVLFPVISSKISVLALGPTRFIIQRVPVGFFPGVKPPDHERGSTVLYSLVAWRLIKQRTA
jgi:hypothetical protein